MFAPILTLLNATKIIIILVYHSKLDNLFQLMLYTFIHPRVCDTLLHGPIESVLFLNKVELALYRELPFYLYLLSCHSPRSFMFIFYYCCRSRRRRWSLFVKKNLDQLFGARNTSCFCLRMWKCIHAQSKVAEHSVTKISTGTEANYMTSFHRRLKITSPDRHSTAAAAATSRAIVMIQMIVYSMRCIFVYNSK